MYSGMKVPFDQKTPTLRNDEIATICMLHMRTHNATHFSKMYLRQPNTKSCIKILCNMHILGQLPKCVVFS